MKENPDQNMDGILAALPKEGEKYLGSVSLVREIMMDYFQECVRKQGEEHYVQIAMRYAPIFLGKNKEYRPVPSWNAPGGIDKFIEKQLNIRAETPETAVTYALMQMYRDAAEAVTMKASTNEKQEQFLGQMEMWLKILMGIDPDEQGVNLIPSTEA